MIATDPCLFARSDRTYDCLRAVVVASGPQRFVGKYTVYKRYGKPKRKGGKLQWIQWNENGLSRAIICFNKGSNSWTLVSSDTRDNIKYDTRDNKYTRQYSSSDNHGRDTPWGEDHKMNGANWRLTGPDHDTLQTRYPDHGAGYLPRPLKFEGMRAPVSKSCVPKQSELSR